LVRVLAFGVILSAGAAEAKELAFELFSTKRGKFVKLSASGTKVLCHIPHDFPAKTLKDIWRVLSLDLVF
jgi:hypothetical protein